MSDEKLTRALRQSGGNVLAAANRLKMKAAELRALIKINPRVLEAALEREERRLDQAEAFLRQELRSPELTKRLAAAQHVLRHTAAGRRRGFL